MKKLLFLVLIVFSLNGCTNKDKRLKLIQIDEFGKQEYIYDCFDIMRKERKSRFNKDEESLINKCLLNKDEYDFRISVLCGEKLVEEERFKKYNELLKKRESSLYRFAKALQAGSKADNFADAFSNAFAEGATGTVDRNIERLDISLDNLTINAIKYICSCTANKFLFSIGEKAFDEEPENTIRKNSYKYSVAYNGCYDFYKEYL